MTESTVRYHAYILLDCPFCEKAVELLKSKKQTFAVTVLDNDRKTLKEIKEKYSHQTVPLILIKTEEDDEEKLLGGFSDLEKTFNVR